MFNDKSIHNVKSYLLNLQNTICDEFSKIDNKANFIEDAWNRPQGGGGITRSLANGNIFEKAGVSFSHVFGKKLPPSATEKRPELAGKSFQALGLSLVIHPDNPYIPTSHANIRLFIAGIDTDHPIWWFGGGYDLTPYYAFEEDCIHWHQIASNACKPFGEDVYPRFKKWADEYFYLKHRQEPRGIGGIFFDDLNEWEFDKCFDFLQQVGNSYLNAYVPIVKKRMNTPFDEKEKTFQKYRRGRYVEFNIIYDRGTLFGLQSGGRTESILMSLPPEVNWGYNWQAPKNSVEDKLLTDFLIDKDWI